ncbi:MAG: hypothetical protein P1V97_36090, partial [Planctomycetota bacterium]|nr:hypothetical protein [Planctomycetota bacterium]
EATYLWELKKIGDRVVKAPLAGWISRFSAPNSLMITGLGRMILWNYLEDKIEFEASYDESLHAFSGAVSHSGQSMIVGHKEMKMSCWTLADRKLNWRIDALRPPPISFGQVRSILLSKDQSEVISGGGDGKVHFWDIATGELKRSLAAHSSWVHAMALHPDGRRLLTVSNDLTVRLWDINTETLIWDFAGHGGPVLSLAVSNDGKQLLSGGFDRAARVWDLSTGEEEQSHTDQRVTISQVAWGKKRSQFVTVGQGILVYNKEKNQALTANIGREEAHQIHFGQDYLYVTSKKGQLFRVDPMTMKAEQVTVSLPFSYSITESPGGVYLAIGGGRGAMCMLELSKTEKGCFIRRSNAILAHDSVVTALAFLKDDLTLVTSSKDGSIKVWDTKTAVIKRKILAHPKGVYRFAISADERFIISLGVGGEMSVWSLEDGTLLDTISFMRLGEAPCSVAASPVKNTFYIGLSSGAIFEYEIDPGR